MEEELPTCKGLLLKPQKDPGRAGRAFGLSTAAYDFRSLNSETLPTSPIGREESETQQFLTIFREKKNG